MYTHLFSFRVQMNMLLTACAALLIAAIPVTVTFAQSYNYNYNNNYNNGNYNNGWHQDYGAMQPQQYTYWCMNQGGGYYSAMPCPVYPPQQSYQHQSYQSYYPHHQSYASYMPQYSYGYYPQYYYQPNYYGYNYGSFNYNYNVNYATNWSYWY